MASGGKAVSTASKSIKSSKRLRLAAWMNLFNEATVAWQDVKQA